MSYQRQLIFAGAAALTALAATAAAQSLPKESPFAPAAGPAAFADTKAAPSTYEFVGMTVMGNATLLSINRVSDKHSIWVPLGKTVNQITAVSYDPRSESAVVRAENQTLTLKMRKAAIMPIANAPMPAAEPVAPPPAPVATTGGDMPPSMPPPPMTDDEKATEARMMVSDLLEIGLRQRQAYEQAQREANARARNAAPLPASTTATKR